MQMLRTFAKDAFRFGLTSWRWLGISGKTPRFTTCFGDVFLESLEGWWFLDTMEGTLELRWSTAVDMYAELEAPDGRATYLMDDLVRDAEQRGLRLGAKDIFTFNPHPAIGGDMTADTLTTMRFSLALNWAGTMHEQLRQAPADSAAQPQAPAAALWVSQAAPVRVDTAHPAYAEPHPPTGSFAVTGPYGHVPTETGTFPHYDPSFSTYDTQQAAGTYEAEPMTGQHAAAAPAPREDPRPYVQAGEAPAWDDIWGR
ncbi:hypothetical protein GCM10028784_36260 [Myceligenerans cantabricum]